MKLIVYCPCVLYYHKMDSLTLIGSCVCDRLSSITTCHASGGTKEQLIQTSLGGHEVRVTKLTNHTVILDRELTDAHLFNKRQSYRKIINMLNQRMFSLGMSMCTCWSHHHPYGTPEHLCCLKLHKCVCVCVCKWIVGMYWDGLHV